MPPVMAPPPRSDVEPVTEILHGVSVTEPYRWLEDQDAPRTRCWIEEQTRYARAYLENIPGRHRILGQLLIDPMERGTDKFTAAKPLRVSPDGRLLLYEVKDGERERGRSSWLKSKPGTASPIPLPRAHLAHLLAFALGGKGFFYVQQVVDLKKDNYPGDCSA